MNSVLQDWVMELPLREQGTLLTGVRGCDVAPKNPITIVEENGCSTGEDTAERKLSAFLRWCILNPADPREVDYPGAWFSSTLSDWKPSQLGHYPLHWYSHLMHCYEVVAYRHPSGAVRDKAFVVYVRLVRNLHLNIETIGEMIERLSEDRVAKGQIVS
jgi:hypothetical protein